MLGRFFASPGNPGIAEHAEIVGLQVGDHEAVASFCAAKEIGLVVVGPEVPLVAGLADALESRSIAVFGPSAMAARLEGSKGFTKDLCSLHDIPTARYQRFSDAAKARQYVENGGLPIVVKADGLASGKGVAIAETREAALTAVDACFDGDFGGAGAEIVVEEFLEGEEVSYFCICDGERAIPFGTAQDYKRAFEQDRGPNTGGMGAVSPAHPMTPSLDHRVMTEIIEPTLRGMSQTGSPFKGVLYAGLMLTSDGPKLIEYNVRFGDPECQVLMMRLSGDLLPILLAAARGDLSDTAAEWSPLKALTVVMAAKGYPGAYRKGTSIRSLPATAEDLRVFQAGTTLADGDGAAGLLAVGGRVLNVTATALSMKEAARRAYEAVETIEWEDAFWRSDIGHRAIMREGH